MTSGILPPGLESLSIDRTRTTRDANKDLGQEEFFKLMIAQLKNQDPMKPMENGEFLSQIAQFGTVNGIGELQKSFSLLATSMQSSQALQASTMVGRSVLLEGDRVVIGDSLQASGAIELPQAASEVTVSIEDAAGQVVRQIHLGGHAAGLVQFTWEGLDDAGAAVAPGHYFVSAQGTFAGVGAQSLATLVKLKVESVTVPGNGEAPQLNLSDRRSVTLGDVREVM